MASYKGMYEAAMAEARALQAKIDEMTKLDTMTADLAADLSDKDAKEFITTFADRCENRAEVALLMRVLTKVGA